MQFDDLVPDVLRHILTFLPGAAVARLDTVSRFVNSLTRGDVSFAKPNPRPPKTNPNPNPTTPYPNQTGAAVGHPPRAGVWRRRVFFGGGAPLPAAR